ncbi:MAG: carboxypeptidase regulatory-like domain-containing protein, partial [Planctomycetota bacterium]|nr:carboxypeptidase regulatory-like domain-containing protein [Planctomycetota bacterium]
SRIPVFAVSGVDGSFELQLDSDAYSGLKLELKSVDSFARGSLVLAGDQLTGGYDLGEIQLVEAMEFAYRAVRSDGSGIEGARVVCSDSFSGGSATNAEGLGVIHLPANAGPCTLHAFGFRPAPFLPGAVSAEAVRIELTPAATANWHVTNDRGHTLGGVSVRVRSGERLFADGGAFTPNRLDQSYQGASFVKVGTDQDLPYSEFQLNAAGHLQLSNLALGAPILVEVLDQMGHLVHSARMGAFTAGERRVETIEVPGRLHGFHGWVRDRSGQVLAGVELELTDTEGKSVRSFSRTDGQVVFERLAGIRYDLTVRKRGFVAQTISGLSFTAGAGSSEATPYEVTLERAVDLAIHVVSSANVSVPGGRITARRVVDGQIFDAGPVAAASQTLVDLDQGTLELTLDLGGVLYTEIVRPHMTHSVEFRVPAHGSAQVGWDLPESTDRDQELALVAVALSLEGEVLGDRAPIQVGIEQGAELQGVTEFPALLPGTYTLELMGRSQQDGEGAQPAPESEVWIPLSTPQQIQVVRGGMVRADIRL